MADEAPKIVRRSQRRKKEKYSDHARPRIKFRAGQLKKIAELEAKEGLSNINGKQSPPIVSVESVINLGFMAKIVLR